MNHTPHLKSNGRVDKPKREAKFDVTCSCGKWSAENLTSQQARGEHAAHLQAVQADGADGAEAYQ